MLGEIYDVDSDMLKRLDELEEHPKFYERTEEKVLLASEAALKPEKTFEEVIRRTYACVYRMLVYRTQQVSVSFFIPFVGRRVDESLDILSAEIQILPAGQYQVRVLHQQRKSRAEVLRKVCPRSVLRSQKGCAISCRRLLSLCSEKDASSINDVL